MQTPNSVLKNLFARKIFSTVNFLFVPFFWHYQSIIMLLPISNSRLFFIVLLLTIEPRSYFFTLGKECIKSMFGQTCSEDGDCHTHNELHLYCNKSLGANVCSFQLQSYIGHAAVDLDCEGIQYSAESWSNPIPDGLIKQGIDCMRMCLHVHTCFGISIVKRKCYLKNDKCFNNLVSKPGSSIGILSVVREDYRCGCHYPFTRMTSDGQTVTWVPDCPEKQLTRNPYRCCSEKGLCISCGQNASESVEGGATGQFALFQK